MKITNGTTILAALSGLLVAGVGQGAVINVGNANPGQQAADLISVSQTWTQDNTYNLLDQIYVMPGVTLTIDAGTVVASTPTANGSGSLCITRGAQIFVNGTRDKPVIMTSTNDTATWTGGNPKTGTWRPAAGEWGNLTILGQAFISNSLVAGNSSTCNANNLSPMEGLIAGFPGDTKILYGGNSDNDDSGTIKYLSLRYGGRVIGATNELNGISMGGVGRGTDIHHIDIMNNLDDGIEIWGGTANLKYVNVWNIGDDGFDLDQGYRGKCQFGLIVQGYSVDAAQQSGVGDNNFELDGAEDSDAQPVTTCAVYNFTVIGQPISGDDGTAWRDNARVQFRNCIFMDLGEQLVQFDNNDGVSQGYGFNGTLSWLDTWTTSYTVSSMAGAVNGCSNPNQRYQAQTAGLTSCGQGFLAEITDSVFYNNLNGSAYTNANGASAVGVTVGANSNPAKCNIVATNSPIVSIARGPNVTSQNVLPVISLDPRANNDATSSSGQAPADNFYTPVMYRGAFNTTENWLCNWTAADAYGFVVAPPGGCPAECLADVANDDFQVNIDDLLVVINSWGQSGGIGDINRSGLVNIDDLLAVINGWGPC
jgi:hypothetical protein